MKTAQSRGFYIDLQIRRRRDSIESPSHHKDKMQIPTTKSTNHSKKLNVTVHNKQEQKNSLTTIPQVQIKKIIISEFKVNESDNNISTNPQNLNNLSVQPTRRESSLNHACPITQKLSRQQFQQVNLKEKLNKKQIISQILKKEAQIQFYQNLLSEKISKNIKQLQNRQRQYEEYIQSLISVYQSEIQKHKQLSKDIQDKQFEKKRYIINLQGKMGLNFSPKQLSTFSGMSPDSMLLDSIQKHENFEQLKKKRSELFSFGSSNKINKSRSLTKQLGANQFLITGKSLIQKGRKIIFN